MNNEIGGDLDALRSQGARDGSHDNTRAQTKHRPTLA